MNTTEWRYLTTTQKAWEILIMAGGLALLSSGVLLPSIYQALLK